MAFIKERTPKMAEGMEKKLMSYVLGRVKGKRGLTTYLDHHAGINGKWLNPDVVYNFRVKLFLRISIFMLCVTDEDTARKEWMKVFDKAVKLKKTYGPCRHCKQHKHLTKQDKK